MQNYKIRKTCRQNNRRSNYTNTKSKSANRNFRSINKIIFWSIASSSKAARRSKKQNGTGKLPQNKLRIIYANPRGIKSKMQSLTLLCVQGVGGGVNLPAPPPCRIFFNNFFFTQAKSLKFSDVKFLSFRQNVAQFH